MSAEQYPPTLSYAAFEGAFTASEVEMIEGYGEKLALEKASLVGRELNDEYGRIRVTQTAWVKPTPETKWVFDRMQVVVRTLNARIWQFDLTGFSEDFQYTVYRDAEGGHYDWHVDQGQLVKRRKLSMSVQLSDPSHYEGCELQLHATNSIETAPKGRGTVIAFPSYVLHRVTPIVSGTRKALVVWSTGPQFK